MYNYNNSKPSSAKINSCFFFYFGDYLNKNDIPEFELRKIKEGN